MDGLDILLAGQPPDKPTKLRKVADHWMLYGGPNDPQLGARTVAVAKIVDMVSAKRTIKDFPPPNPANFAAISETLYVWVGGFNPPTDMKAEPKKKAEPTKLEFGRKDGDTIHVRAHPAGRPSERVHAAGHGQDRSRYGRRAGDTRQDAARPARYLPADLRSRFRAAPWR